MVLPDGRGVSLGRALCREVLVRLLLGGLVIGGLTDVLWASWDPQKRAVHDIAVKTRVVKAGGS